MTRLFPSAAMEGTKTNPKVASKYVALEWNTVLGSLSLFRTKVLFTLDLLPKKMCG